MQKTACKKQGLDFFLLSKKRRGSLNNKKSPDPAFCTLFFAPHIWDHIFLKLQTLQKYQVDLINQISGCRLIGLIASLASIFWLNTLWHFNRKANMRCHKGHGKAQIFDLEIFMHLLRKNGQKCARIGGFENSWFQ